MLFKVLVAFPYSVDGRFTEMLAEGGVVPIREDLVEGLTDGEYVREATEEEIAEAAGGAVVLPQPVEIPDDWRELNWFKYRGIAQALNGGQSVGNKAAAVAIIEAELARRAEL
jgi:hypothetical protein